MSKLKSYLGYSCGVLLLLANAPIYAKDQLISAEIINTSQGSVQQVPLSLQLMAAVSQRAQQVEVLDAKGQAMPYRFESTKQVPRQTDMPLQVYQWPTQQSDANWQQIEQLKLQLKQGQSEATLTWPQLEAPAKPAGHQNTNQALVWLLVAPNSEQQQTAQQLLLNWSSKPISSRVQIEGSNDLSNWQFAGTGNILETQNAAQQVVKQQHIDVQNTYRFWRVQLDQPIQLQAATLRREYQEAEIWQREVFEFKPSSQAGQWLLETASPIELQRFKLDIPKNQLWSVSVEAEQNQQGRMLWQPVAKTALFNLEPTVALAKNDQIELDSAMQASSWKLMIPNIDPKQALSVELSMPQRYLFFLAQGQAPYQLRIGAKQSSDMSLPTQLPVGHQAQLGKVVLADQPRSYQQYGLWAGLIFLVLVLAFAAWRLLNASQKNTG